MATSDRNVKSNIFIDVFISRQPIYYQFEGAWGKKDEKNEKKRIKLENYGQNNYSLHTRTLNLTPSFDMILSAWDHPRAGLLPKDRPESRPPSAPSIVTVLFQRIRLKMKKKKRFNNFQFKILTIQVNVEIRLELVKRMAAHIEGISIKIKPGYIDIIKWPLSYYIQLLNKPYRIFAFQHIEVSFRCSSMHFVFHSFAHSFFFSPLLCMQLKSKRAHSPIHIYLDIWIMTKNK